MSSSSWSFRIDKFAGLYLWYWVKSMEILEQHLYSREIRSTSRARCQLICELRGAWSKFNFQGFHYNIRDNTDKFLSWSSNLKEEERSSCWWIWFRKKLVHENFAEWATAKSGDWFGHHAHGPLLEFKYSKYSEVVRIPSWEEAQRCLYCTIW